MDAARRGAGAAELHSADCRPEPPRRWAAVWRRHHASGAGAARCRVWRQRFPVFSQWRCSCYPDARLPPGVLADGVLPRAQRQGTVDLVLKRWSADYPDPDTFMHTLHSTEGHTGHLCGSPALDRLIERGRAEPNPVARDAIYRELEGLLAREARVVPLFHEQAYRLARRGVEGLSVSFGSPTVSYDELRVLA
jgi:hypothetical protein